MKKTLVSIAAASLIVSSAMAADKGIDIVTTGQAVVYYETKADNATGSDDLFDQNTAAANYGVQLNLDADLKNGFTFGSQLSYLGTLGLEKNLVSNTRQSTTSVGAMDNISDEIALTKIFVAKKVGNTTVKLGRQALPKSLSPLAYSEDWNVFQNTFEAALVVNSDIPDTLLVGAYVGQSNGSSGANFSTFDNLKVGGTTAQVQGTAYMLTVQNASVPMTTITASYYQLADLGTPEVAEYTDLDANNVATFGTVIPAVAAVHHEGASAVWVDVAVADKSLPMGLKLGLQGGSIMPEYSTYENTTALGVKVGLAPVEALTLCAAYTSVSDGTAAIKNTGTGVKTPLFTQMIYNQNAISRAADTFMLKAAYNTGAYGTIIAQGTMTTDTSDGGTGELGNLERRNGVDTDYRDLELVYKVKVSGMDLMAAYINRDWSEKSGTADEENAVRIVARYNF